MSTLFVSPSPRLPVLNTMTRAELAECTRLRTQGWSFAQLAPRYGTSAATLCRLLQKHESNGGDEQATLAKAYATGPRDGHPLTTQEIAALHLLRTRHRSIKLAAEELLRHKDCQPATRERLEEVFAAAAENRREPSWPQWLKRACVVTPEVQNALKGPKHLQGCEPARPRGLFFIDEHGINQPLFANALWEFDDESENTPWLELDENGKPRVNRQTLKAVDYYANFYLGMRAVSRDSDGYRVEDQADFLLELIDAHGMPVRVRIERGPWQNNFWFGIPLPNRWWQTSECASLRWGGIHTAAGGPIHVMQAKKSREKGMVEGSFNNRQNIAAGSSLDIGRVRGENESAARAHRMALYGNEQAMARFPGASERADMSAEILRAANNQVKFRAHLFGKRGVVPAELYAEAVKRPLPSDERWRFLPCKGHKTLTGQTLSIEAKGHDLPFVFAAEGHAPGWDAKPWIPQGWRLLYAFHPLRPDLGCHIFNGVHPDHAMNPGRYPLGMPMGVLPFAPLAPQWREDGERGDFAGRKRWAASVRSETRIVKAGAKGVRVSSQVTRSAGLRTTRIGSPDPLMNLDKGAPPVADILTTPLERGGEFRSAADPHAGSGEADRGRPGQTAAYATKHGPTRCAQGSLSRRESALAALEALESDL